MMTFPCMESQTIHVPKHQPEMCLIPVMPLDPGDNQILRLQTMPQTIH